MRLLARLLPLEDGDAARAGVGIPAAARGKRRTVALRRCLMLGRLLV